MGLELKSILTIVGKNVDLVGLSVDLIDEVLEPALKEVVASSENTIDDMVLAALYPPLKEALKAQAKLRLGDLLPKPDDAEA
jgi:hypothetical protein